MVLLQVFSGQTAGRECTARRFPFKIGRAVDADLRLEHRGVWEHHLEIQLKQPEGFHLAVMPNALAALNGESVRETHLRNGDIIDIGGVRIRFWIGPTTQPGQAWREWCTWAALGLVTLLQITLIYRLLR